MELLPRPLLPSWNLIVTVMGLEKELSMFWIAVLIVPSMVAALGSFVMLLSKIGLITSVGTTRSSRCSNLEAGNAVGGWNDDRIGIATSVW